MCEEEGIVTVLFRGGIFEKGLEPQKLESGGGKWGEASINRKKVLLKIDQKMIPSG